MMKALKLLSLVAYSFPNKHKINHISHEHAYDYVYFQDDKIRCKLPIFREDLNSVWLHLYLTH